MDLIPVLQALATIGAVTCGAAYTYGYILKPKGSRRLHVVSLLFSGVALANVPGLLQAPGTSDTTIYAVNLVFFLLISSVLQGVTAFRGRKGDRRAPRAADESAEAPRRQLADAA